jgi:hypothetical protein
MTGATIAAGSDVLTVLTIAAGSSEICFDSATMSDAGGSGLSTTTGDCYPGGGGTGGGDDSVVDLEFGNVDFDAGTVEVLMTNSEPVGGFQFSVSGATITGASGGSAAANTFMVSASGGTALGFSMTGATIAAGSGVLTVLTIAAGSSEICFDAATMSDAGGSGLSTTTGDCYPGGGGTGGGDDSVVDLEFGNVDFDAGTVEVLMTNSEPVGGFQFSVSGATITGASGGSATTAGFMVSASGSTALGFSLTGGTIPSGSGVLTELSIGAGASEVCFAAATMSDSAGSALSTTTGDCSGGGGVIAPVYGCTDMSACNYDQGATDDDGSCEYESCSGCMDMGADNYDMDATIPCDGCCEYPPPTFNIYRDDGQGWRRIFAATITWDCCIHVIIISTHIHTA